MIIPIPTVVRDLIERIITGDDSAIPALHDAYTEMGVKHDGFILSTLMSDVPKQYLEFWLLGYRRFIYFDTCKMVFLYRDQSGYEN